MTQSSKRPPVGHHRHRPVAHPGRPLLHLPDGRDGRPGDQGRAAQGRRRRPGLRPLRQRQVDLLRLDQPRQGEHRARPQERRAPRRSSRSCSRRPTSSSRTSGPARWRSWATAGRRCIAKYPKLIYASASGFGHTGPNSKDPAYDVVVQGMGGIMSITGDEGQPPSRVGISIGDIAAGPVHGGRGPGGAGHERKSGEAPRSTSRCSTARSRSKRTRSCATRSRASPRPVGTRHPATTPFQAFETADGAIIIAAGNDSLFIKMCEALGLEASATEPRLQVERAAPEASSSSSTRSNRC